MSKRVPWPAVSVGLAQRATAGDILASGTTVQRVSAAVPLEALPSLVVAGQAVPFAVYRVRGEMSPAARSAPSGEPHRRDFVGRQSELDALLAGWSRVQGGQGQVIGVIGDAGMGKSRLLEAFRQAIEGHTVMYLSGRCESYGQSTPYLPLKAIVEQACGLRQTDSAGYVETRSVLDYEN